MLAILQLVFLGILPMSCSDRAALLFDLEQEKAEILKMHAAQRSNHFEKDSVSAARQLSDRFISVNRGEVKQPTIEETMKRYHRYFSAVEFVKWDDVAEPVVRFSADGSMAYTIVEKEVIVRYTDEGQVLEDRIEFAWVAIYAKGPAGWKIDCVSSTNKEVTTRPADEDA